MKISIFKSALFPVIFVFLIICFSTCPARALITNGYFSDDPPGTGWTYSYAEISSDITDYYGNGIAYLRPDFEDEASISEVYQNNIFLSSNDTQLLFDIIMYKSKVGGDTDTFTATFGTKDYTLLSSGISGSEYKETVVFDLTGWTSGPYNLNFQLDNVPDGIFTSVLVDNVHFIPAPGAFLLAAIGLFSTAASRKKLKA